MTITPELRAAFRWHMRNNRPAFYYAQGYAGRNAWPERAHGIAKEALRRAHSDIAAGKARYPAPIRGHAMRAGFDADKPGSVYVENPEAFGLRLVGRVAADTPRSSVWDTNGKTGWITDPYGETWRDGSGLVYGLVYQLPARKGVSRFVAAYGNGDNPSCALIAFDTVYTSDAGGTYDTAREDDAARDAARAADSMAQHEAESEREYQCAWQAGSRWADLGVQLSDARRELLDILRERRAVKGQSDYPALCRAIRESARRLMSDIAETRAKRARLAEGDVYPLIFWSGEDRLRDAFAEGAGITAFPG